MNTSDAFINALNRLNKKQREAVDSIYGPLMVIAGPGTGKTQLLSIRVGNILRNTDVEPSNILCLTFTEAGREEMYERLENLIGRPSSDVNVYTYHSFGSDLIRNYPEYFSDMTSSNLVEDVNKINIIKKIIDGLSYKNKFKNIEDDNLDSLISTISDLKKALITPEKLNKIAEENLAFIESKKELLKELTPELSRVTNKSVPFFTQLLDENYEDDESLKALFNSSLIDGIEHFKETKKTSLLTAFKGDFLTLNRDKFYEVESIKTNQKLLDLNEIYTKYLVITKGKKLHDFDDIIINVVNALRNNQEFRYALQEKYQYILLDEYQDSNEAQAEIVKLLSDHPIHEGRPNVMAVGDDDQAIYAFQGAKHFHMLDFVKQYNDVKVVVLDQNYRSNQNIIDLSQVVSNKISSRLTTEIGLDKTFKSNNQNQGNIQRLVFNSPIEEETYLINLFKNKKNVALLGTKHQTLQKYAYIFDSEGINVSYERRENVLEDKLVEIVLLNLGIVHALSKNNQHRAGELIPKLLNEEYLAIDFREIIEISHNKKGNLIDRLYNQPNTKELSNFLSKLSVDATTLSFDHIIDKIIGLSAVQINSKELTNKFHEFYLKEDANLVSLLSKLVVIREKFEQFIMPEKLERNIDNFIAYIDAAKINNVVLASNEKINNNKDIKLMTAYSSKGREFDSVIIPNFTDNVWGKLKKGKPNMIGLPINLKFIRNASDSADDKLRLLYVALTRAKNELILTSSLSDGFNSPLKPVTFLDEAEKKVDVSDELTISTVLSPHFSEEPITAEEIKVPRKVVIEDWQSGYRLYENKTEVEEILKDSIKSLRLSPSAFINFIDIERSSPRHFLERHILKYPEPENTSMFYGTLIHSALEFVQKELNTTGSIPSYDQIINVVKNDLDKKILTETEKESLLHKSEDLIKHYLENYVSEFRVGDLSEVSLYEDKIEIDGVKMSGKIDRISINKDNKVIRIFDYKTGTPFDTWADKRKSHINKYQLYFYKLLLNNSRKYKDYEIKIGTIDFVESTDQTHTLDLEFNPEEEAKIRKLIVIVWEHIMNLNFPDVSMYKESIAGINQFEKDLLSGKI